MKGDEVPPQVYTSESETLNSILYAKKFSLGYLKKEDTSQVYMAKNTI